MHAPRRPKGCSRHLIAVPMTIAGATSAVRPGSHPVMTRASDHCPLTVSAAGSTLTTPLSSPAGPQPGKELPNLQFRSSRAAATAQPPAGVGATPNVPPTQSFRGRAECLRRRSDCGRKTDRPDAGFSVPPGCEQAGHTERPHGATLSASLWSGRPQRWSSSHHPETRRQ